MLLGERLTTDRRDTALHSGIVFSTPVLPVPRSAVPRASSAPSAHASTAPDGAPAASTADMVLVAAGVTKLGDAGVSTAVRGFYLDRTEVTVRAYQACVAKRMCSAADHVSLPRGAGDRWGPVVSDTPDAGSDSGDGNVAARVAEYVEVWTRRCNAPRGAEDHPVNCVDYAGAESFCRWIGKRLPTEAELDLAARGVEGRVYAWGAEPPECGRACYDKNGGCRERGASVATCAGGMHPADHTPEGIFDMAGDVAEWTADSGGAGSAATRMVRGGSFIDEAEALTATTRAVVPPALAHVAIGFRCALDAPAKATP
jgi:serine/threonine-protein kinase